MGHIRSHGWRELLFEQRPAKSKKSVLSIDASGLLTGVLRI
jgi:hypothetical protein